MANELIHYGILGMKWGVRRSEAELARARGKKIEPHEDYVKAHSKKNIKEMSDQELRERLNRLNMESQYKKLRPSNVSKGKQYVRDAIKVTTAVGSITSTALTIYNNWEKIKSLVN